MSESKTKSIVEMANGAFIERIDYEMKKVIANILDPNTKATAKRKLTVTFEFAPDDERMNIIPSMVVKPTLAATNAVVTALYVAGDAENGEAQIVEMTRQVPGQVSLGGEIQEPPALLRIVD